MENPVNPYIPASKSLPEITFKGLILGILLALVLAAANTYLGLKVGITITGSIPAAIVAMGLLSFFKQSNILENNIVQTTASAGDALASGIIFTLPALIIVKFWTNFNYLESVVIGILGGALGVLFSIPLRRILTYDKNLPFPEGFAIGNVLKFSDSSNNNIRYLLLGSLVGAVINLGQNGFKVLSGAWSYWFSKNGIIYGFGLGFDAALIGAGYIVGITVAMSMLVGAIIGRVIAVPVLSIVNTLPDIADASQVAFDIWSNQIRYIGMGTMLVGGFWAIVTLAKPMLIGIQTSLSALKDTQEGGLLSIPRTERDIPINYVFWGCLAIAISLTFLFLSYIGNSSLGLSTSLSWTVALINVAYLLTAGFIFSAICGYLAGLVGASSSPISGLVLAAILLISLLLFPIISCEVSLIGNPDKIKAAVAVAIFVATFSGAAAAIANDNLQDLKAGQIVGSTPWKQQFMLITGVCVAAFIIPLVLELLFNAYGIGDILPRADMDPGNALAAPQASLIASVAEGAFGGYLPWDMITIGAFIAILCILVDNLLKKKGMGLPVLAVGIGIYIPLAATIPLVIGGFISYLTQRSLSRNKSQNTEERQQRGLTLACGFVAGASIMGILLAIPAVVFKDSNVLSIAPNGFAPYATTLSFIITALLGYWLFHSVNRK